MTPDDLTAKERRIFPRTYSRNWILRVDMKNVENKMIVRFIWNQFIFVEVDVWLRQWHKPSGNL